MFKDIIGEYNEDELSSLVMPSLINGHVDVLEDILHLIPLRDNFFFKALNLGTVECINMLLQHSSISWSDDHILNESGMI